MSTPQKKSTKKENKYYLWLDYDEDRSESGDSDHGDGTPYSGYSRHYIQWNLNGVHRKEDSIEKFFKDSKEVSEETFNSEKVWVVVVRYGDGGTFGHTDGYWDIPLITSSRNEAIEKVEFIKQTVKGQVKKPDEYYTWNGYFANLEDVYAKEFTVDDHSKIYR